MAYIVNNTAGTVIATIADGTIDTSNTSITLLGKGFNNYGEIVAENWVKMIEHFANTTAPGNAIRGQLWFDTTNGRIMLNTSDTFGSPTWIEIQSTILSATEPTTGFGSGALWYDTANNLLNITTDGVAWTTIKSIKTATGGEPLVAGSETGDLFYDQDTFELKVLSADLHGTASAGWDVIGPAWYKGSTAPTSPTDGDEWWDSTNKQLYIYDGSTTTYRLVGPSGPSSTSASKIGAGLETGQYAIEIDGKALLAMIVDDDIMGLWSKEDFTPTVPIRELVASGTGTVTVGVPAVVIGPTRQWHFHNIAEVTPVTDIKRGLNLPTVLGPTSEETVFNGTATQALYT